MVNRLTTLSDRNTAQDLLPAWVPSEEQIQATNIAALMQELSMNSYHELHAWSAQHRAEFWDTMIRRLGICFRQPYDQLVELAQGLELPKWLVGARFNIVESCFRAPQNTPAIISQSAGKSLHTLTFGELEALTNQVANGLVAVGFQVGDAIAIAMPMTVESVAIYLGIVKAGCVVVSIADSFSAREMATRLEISQAKAIFTQDYTRRSGKELPLYSKLIDANAPTAIVQKLHPTSSPQFNSLPFRSLQLRSGDLNWDEFLSSNPHFDAVPAAPSAHTNILFSSGTTGEPKAIPWNQTTPIKCAVDGHLHHDIHPGDVVAWYTNLGWMMGPWLIYASLINRATIALYDDAPGDRSYGEFIQNAHVTMLGVVPSLVSTWKATRCMEGLDWSAIKAFSSTGECSNPQDMRYLMDLAGGKPIIEYCGGTEIGGGYITGTLVQPCIPATFTTPALGLDIAILDAEGHPSDNGESFIIPPSLGLSTELLNQDHHQVYFANIPQSVGFAPLPHEQTAMSLVHVPYSLLPTSQSPLPCILRRHGDQIERLPNGFYRAHGRVDDTMNLSGIKVSSAEIERILNAVEGICETAAIALAPVDGGPSQLVIYAVVHPEHQIDKAMLHTQLQTTLKQQLNPLFKIHDLVVVDVLPRTASNKIMRRILRDRWKEGADFRRQ